METIHDIMNLPFAPLLRTDTSSFNPCDEDILAEISCCCSAFVPCFPLVLIETIEAYHPPYSVVLALTLGAAIPA